jgi:hypothetical protein
VSIPPWLAALAPKIASASIGEVTVYATDEEAIHQCQAAADDDAQRLDLEIAPDTRFRAWARPASLSPRLAHAKELQVSVREDQASAEMDFLIRASPRRLLGGPWEYIPGRLPHTEGARDGRSGSRGMGSG